MRGNEKGDAGGMFKYMWAKPDLAPFGTPLPHQCPQCFSFRPWGKRSHVDGIHSFPCEGSKKDGKRCTHIITFAPPQMRYTSMPKSDWIRYEWA
jgi:hypothetical protein